MVVTTENDEALARAIGREAGQWIWDHRHIFEVQISDDGVAKDQSTDVHTAESAIQAALALKADDALGPPVCINETADNTGCGAPGDATHLLRALLDADLDEGVACFGWMYDPESLEACFEAGVGNTVELSLGGKLEVEQGMGEQGIAGAPIVAQARVRVLNDGVFPTRPGSVGYFNAESRRHLGRMARVTIGAIDVLINASRQQVFDDGAFALAGLDINRYKIVGIKSSTHFRAGWAPISEAILTADEPGWSSNNLFVFEPLREKKVVRWPTTDGTSYTPNARL